MDEDNLEWLRDACPPRHQAKLRLLMAYAPGGGPVVPDPYYGGPAGFEAVLTRRMYFAIRPLVSIVVIRPSSQNVRETSTFTRGFPHVFRPRLRHTPPVSVSPPSMTIVWPVTQAASSESRNATTEPTSSGTPSRLSG